MHDFLLTGKKNPLTLPESREIVEVEGERSFGTRSPEAVQPLTPRFGDARGRDS